MSWSPFPPSFFHSPATCPSYSSPPPTNDPSSILHPDSPRMLLAWGIAGFFSLFATVMSLVLVVRHWQYFTKAEYQRPITRILFMVPIYAVCSWISFRYYKIAVYLNVIRDCYEGFVVWSFFNLCLQYLGPDRQTRLEVLSRKERRRLPPPACCFRHNPQEPHFLSYCNLGIVQYVVIRVGTTIAAVTLASLHKLCPESMSPRFGHFWLVIFNSVSVGVAMFTLALFYLAVREDIKNFNPILQFLSVKFVIFFAFWQSVLIKILAHLSYLPTTSPTDTARLSASLANFLICLEMAMASVIHLWAFSYRPFVPEDGGRKTVWEGMWETLRFLDVWEDLRAVGVFLRVKFEGRRDVLEGWRRWSSTRLSDAPEERQALMAGDEREELGEES